MESSQETYVTIKYRLENKGSEPKLNGIGARRKIEIAANASSSEPMLNDIGVRLITFLDNSEIGSEPK